MADLAGCIADFFQQQPAVIAWGVAAPEPVACADRFEQWLAAGRHGDMAYLEKHREVRFEPRNFFPVAQSIVLFLHRCPERILAPGVPTEALVSAHARGPDYHHVMKKLIHELAATLAETFRDLKLKPFVDSAPVAERELAVRAGLGWIAKNSMLIHPRYGSQVFIGGFFLDRPLPPAPTAVPDGCGACRTCIDACPTRAIDDNRQIDATRCISYLTIEKKGNIEATLRGRMGNRIFGCDTCQQVCPWNRDHLAGALPEGSKFDRTLEDWQRILQPGGGFKRLFRKTPLYRAGRARMLRNVLIARENREEHAIW